MTETSNRALKDQIRSTAGSMHYWVAWAMRLEGAETAEWTEQTEAARDLAVSDAKLTRVRIRQIDDQIRRAAVRAPFTGVVTSRLHRAGEDVSRGDVLAQMTLVDGASAHVRSAPMEQIPALEFYPFYSLYDRRTAVYFKRFTPAQWRDEQARVAAMAGAAVDMAELARGAPAAHPGPPPSPAPGFFFCDGLPPKIAVPTRTWVAPNAMAVKVPHAVMRGVDEGADDIHYGNNVDHVPLANPLKPTRGLEPRTPSLRVKCSTS